MDIEQKYLASIKENIELQRKLDVAREALGDILETNQGVAHYIAREALNQIKP